MQFYRLFFALLLGTYLLSPMIQDWWYGSPSLWYRPYVIWGILILCAMLLERRRRHDEF